MLFDIKKIRREAMKIKVSIFVLSALCFITAIAAGLSETRSVELINPSFETSDTTGWEVLFPESIWVGVQDDDSWWQSYTVSDISSDGAGTDGVYFAMWYGNAISQITEHVIDGGGTYHVSVDSCSVAGAKGILVQLGYHDGISFTEETSETFIMTNAEDTGPWERFPLEYTPSDNAAGKNLFIQISNNNMGGEWTGIDNILADLSIDGFRLIYPQHEQTHVMPDAVLQWELEEGFTCDVYFGVVGEPNEQVISNAPETTYDPYGEVDMELDTTYYWRVDPIDPNAGGGIPKTYKGLTWTFTTIGEEPAILTNPQHITVAPGTSAEFSVEAASITPINYKWYKVGDDVTVLSTSDTLVINDAELDDEGYYYCVITNDTMVPFESSQARLMTQRLVGWWKLDNDGVDSVDLEVPGAPTHDGILPTEPVFVTDGIDQDAIEFSGDGELISISGSVDYFNFYPQGMTVSAWVSCSFGGTWDGVVGKKQLDPEDEDQGIAGSVLGVNGSSAWNPLAAANMALYGVGTLQGTLVRGNPDDGDIHDDQWHLITGVMAPDYSDRSCRVLIYVDGVLREASESFDMHAVPLSSEALVIGAENESGIGSFHGKVDDVRIYSYAFNDINIALMYTTLKNEAACINQDDPWLQFDVTGQPGETSWCKVDIEDFAKVASVWMKCNLYLDCLQ
jgi:hypothetical protein